MFALQIHGVLENGIRQPLAQKHVEPPQHQDSACACRAEKCTQPPYVQGGGTSFLLVNTYPSPAKNAIIQLEANFR